MSTVFGYYFLIKLNKFVQSLTSSSNFLHEKTSKERRDTFTVFRHYFISLISIN